jgi:hypothetical protein
LVSFLAFSPSSSIHTSFPGGVSTGEVLGLDAVPLEQLNRCVSTLSNGAVHHNVFTFDFIKAST